MDDPCRITNFNLHNTGLKYFFFCQRRDHTTQQSNLTIRSYFFFNLSCPNPFTPSWHSLPLVSMRVREWSGESCEVPIARGPLRGLAVSREGPCVHVAVFPNLNLNLNTGTATGSFLTQKRFVSFAATNGMEPVAWNFLTFNHLLWVTFT